MKLYYSPGACSQAPHIILHELGLSHSSDRVDLRAKKTASGADYLATNPKGAVPALAMDNGELLTENAVILQYLGDRSGLGEVLPPVGNFSRYRVLEWLNFITAELHKSFSPLFNPAASEQTKSFFIELIGKKLDYVEGQLGDGPFLMDQTFTLPDAYLFVITGWTEMLIGLERWPNLAAFRRRMMERESVRIVLRAEGLLQEESAG